MPTLKQGDTGEKVSDLQNALLRAGYLSGTVDGIFGPATTAAIIDYQKAHHLSDDGIPGLATLAALQLWTTVKLVKSSTFTDSTAKFTVDVVASMFPGTPKANIKKNLPGVLDGLRTFNLVDEPMILMALATIRAETASFTPVKEGISKYNTSPGGRSFDLYDDRAEGLGNTGYPDGSKYPGRGYVQLTGRYNYALYGPIVGCDLINNPELACDAKIAGLLLAAFLVKHANRARTALIAGDMKQARKLVNGGKHGLDNFTDAYQRGQTALA